jgi:hypothetical protein
VVSRQALNISEQLAQGATNLLGFRQIIKFVWSLASVRRYLIYSANFMNGSFLTLAGGKPGWDFFGRWSLNTTTDRL